MATTTFKASDVLAKKQAQDNEREVAERERYGVPREQGYTDALLGKKTQQYGFGDVKDRYSDDNNSQRLRFENYAGMSRNDELFQTLGIKRTSKFDYTAYSKWYKNNGNKHAAGFEDVGAQQLEKEQALYAYEHRDQDTSYEQWAWDTFGDKILKENGYHLDNPNWWQARANKNDFSNPMEDEEFVKAMQRKIDYQVNMLGMNKLKDMPNQWEMLLEETPDNDVATAQRLEDARKIYDQRMDEFQDALGSRQKAYSLYKARSLDTFDPIIYDEKGKARFFLDTDGDIITLTEDKALAKRSGYGLAQYHEDGKLDAVHVGSGWHYGANAVKSFGHGVVNTLTDIVSLVPLGAAFLYDMVDWMGPGENKSQVAEAMTWFEGLKTDLKLQDDDTWDADNDGDNNWNDASRVLGGITGQVLLAWATVGIGNAASKAGASATAAGKVATATAMKGVASVASGVSRLTNFSNGVTKTGTLWAQSTKSALMLSSKSAAQNYAQLKMKQPISGWSDEDIALNTAVNFAVNFGVSSAFREVGSEANNFYTRWKPILNKVTQKATPGFTQAVANTGFGQYLTSSAGKYMLLGTGADMFENLATMAADSYYMSNKASEKALFGIPDVFTKEMGSMMSNPAAMTGMIAGGLMQAQQSLDYGVSDMVGRVQGIYGDVVTEMDTQIGKKQKVARTDADFAEIDEMVKMKDALLADMKPKDKADGTKEDAAEAIIRSLDTFTKNLDGEENFVTRIVDKHAADSAKAKIAQRLAFAKDMYYTSYKSHQADVKFAFNDPAGFNEKALLGGNMLNRLSKVSDAFKSMDSLVRTTEAYSRYKDQMNILEALDNAIDKDTPDLKDTEYFKVHNVATLQKDDPDEYTRLIEDHGVTKEEIEDLGGSQFLFTSKISGTDGEKSQLELRRQKAFEFYAKEEAAYLDMLRAEFPDQTFHSTLKQIGKNNGNDSLFVLTTPLDGVNLWKTSQNFTAYLNATHQLLHSTDKKTHLATIAQVLERPQNNDTYADLIYKMWQGGLLSTQDALKINENFGGKLDKLKFNNELGTAIDFVGRYNKAMKTKRKPLVTKVVGEYAADAKLQEILEKGRAVSPKDIEALKTMDFQEPGKKMDNLQKKLKAQKGNSSSISKEEHDKAVDIIFKNIVPDQASPVKMMADVTNGKPEEVLKQYGLTEQAAHAETLAKTATPEEVQAYAKQAMLDSMSNEQLAFLALGERRAAIDESGITRKSVTGDENVAIINLNELSTPFRDTIRKRAANDPVFAKDLENKGATTDKQLLAFLGLPEHYAWQETYWKELMAANTDNGVLRFNLANEADRDALDTMFYRLGYEQTAERILQGEKIRGVYSREDDYEVFEFTNKGNVLDTSIDQGEQVSVDQRASESAALLQRYGGVVYIDDNTIITVNNLTSSASIVTDDAQYRTAKGALREEYKDKSGKLSKKNSGTIAQSFTSNAIRGTVDENLFNWLVIDRVIDLFDEKFSDGYPLEVGSMDGDYYFDIWGKGDSPVFNAEAARKLFAEADTPAKQQQLLFSLMATDASVMKSAQANLYAKGLIPNMGDAGSLRETPFDIAMNASMDFDPEFKFQSKLVGYLKDGGFAFKQYKDEPIKVNNMRYADMVKALSADEYKNNVNAIMLLNQLKAMRAMSAGLEDMKAVFQFFDAESLKLIAADIHNGADDQAIADHLNSLKAKQGQGPAEYSRNKKNTTNRLGNPEDNALHNSLELKQNISVDNYPDGRPEVTAEEIAELRASVQHYAVFVNNNVLTTLVQENPEASLKARFDLNASDDKTLRLSTDDLNTLSAEELAVLQRILPAAEYKKLEALVGKLQKSAFGDEINNPYSTRLQEQNSRQTSKEDSKTGHMEGKDSPQAQEAQGQLARKLKRYREGQERIKASNYHNYQDFSSKLMDQYYNAVDRSVEGKFVHSASIYLENLDNQAAFQSMADDIAYYVRSLSELNTKTSEHGAKLSPEKIEELAFELFVKTSGTEADAEPLRYSVIDKDGNIRYQAHYMRNHRDNELNDLYFNMIDNKWELGDTLLVHNAKSNTLEFVELTPQNRESVKNAILKDMFEHAPYAEKELLRQNIDGALYRQDSEAGKQIADWFVNNLVSHLSQETIERNTMKGAFTRMNAERVSQGLSVISDAAQRRIVRAMHATFNDLQSGSRYTKRFEALMGLWEDEYGHKPDFYDHSQKNSVVARTLAILEHGFSRDMLSDEQQKLLMEWRDMSLLENIEDYINDRDADVNAKILDLLTFYNGKKGTAEISVEKFRDYVRDLHREYAKQSKDGDVIDSIKKAKIALNHKKGGNLKDPATRAYEMTYAKLLADRDSASLYPDTSEDKVLHSLNKYLQKHNYKETTSPEFDQVPMNFLKDFLKKHISRGIDMAELRFMFNDIEDTTESIHKFLEYENLPKNENLVLALSELRDEVRAQGAMSDLPEFSLNDKYELATALNNLAEIGQKRMIVTDMNRIYQSQYKHRRMLSLMDSRGIPNALNAAHVYLMKDMGRNNTDFDAIEAMAVNMLAGGPNLKLDKSGKFFISESDFHNTLKITGTRLGAILGINPYTSEFATFTDMTKALRNPGEVTEYTEAGKYIEPKQGVWAKANGLKGLQTPEEYYKSSNAQAEQGYDFFKDDPIFGGMWDALEVENGKPLSVVEFKTANNPEAWAKGVPEYYKAQVMLYAKKLGLKKAKLVVTFTTADGRADAANFKVDGKNTRLFEFDVDSERIRTKHGDLSIEEAMSRAKTWHDDHIKGRKSPEFDTVRDADTLKRLESAALGAKNSDEKVRVQQVRNLLGHVLGDVTHLKGDSQEAAMEQTFRWLAALIDEGGSGPYGQLPFGDNMETAVNRFKEVMDLTFTPQAMQASDPRVAILAATMKQRLITDRVEAGLKPIASWSDYFEAIQDATATAKDAQMPATFADSVRAYYDEQLANPDSDIAQRYDAAEKGQYAYRVTRNHTDLTKEIFDGVDVDPDLMAQFYNEGLTFYMENIEGDHAYAPNQKQIAYTQNKVNQDLEKLDALNLGKSIVFRRLWGLVNEAIPGDLVKGLDGQDYTMDSNTLAISKTKFVELFGTSYEKFKKKYPDSGSTFYAGVVRSPVDKADGAHAYRIIVTAGEENGGIRMSRDSLLSRHSGDLDGDHVAIIKPLMSQGEQGFFKELADMTAQTYGVLDSLLAQAQEQGLKAKDAIGNVILRMYADNSANGAKLFALVDRAFDELSAKTKTYEEAVEEYKVHLATWMHDAGFSDEQIDGVLLDDKALKRVLQLTFIQEFATDGNIKGQSRIYMTNNRNAYFNQEKYREGDALKNILDMSRRNWLLNVDKETGAHQKQVGGMLTKTSGKGASIADQFGYVPFRMTDESRVLLNSLDLASVQASVAKLSNGAQALFNDLYSKGITQADALEIALQKHESDTRKSTLTADFFQRHQDSQAFGKSLQDFHEANEIAKRYAGGKNAWYGRVSGNVSGYVREIIYGIAEQYGLSEANGLQARVGLKELVEQQRTMPAKLAYVDHAGNADAVYVTEEWAKKNPIYSVFALPRKLVEGQIGQDALTSEVHFNGRTVPVGTKIIDTKADMVLVQSQIEMSSSTKVGLVGTATAKGTVTIIRPGDAYNPIPAGYDVAVAKSAGNGAKFGETFFNDQEYGPQVRETNDDFVGADVHMTILEDTAYQKNEARQATMDTLVFNNSFNGLMPLTFWGGHFLNVEDGTVTIDPTLTRDVINGAITRPDMLQKNGVSYARTGRAIVLAKYLLPKDQANAFISKVLGSADTANSDFESYINKMLQDAGLLELTPEELQLHLKNKYGAKSKELAFLGRNVKRLGMANQITDLDVDTDEARVFKSKSNPDAQLRHSTQAVAPAGFTSQNLMLDETLREVGGEKRMRSLADTFAPMAEVHRELQAEIARLEGKEYNSYNYRDENLINGTKLGAFNVSKGFPGSFGDDYRPISVDDAIELDASYATNFAKKDDKAGTSSGAPVKEYVNLNHVANSLDFDSHERKVTDNLVHHVGKSGAYNVDQYQEAADGHNWAYNLLLRDAIKLNRYGHRLDLLQDLEGYDGASVQPSRSRYEVDEQGKVRYHEVVDAEPIEGESIREVRDAVETNFISAPTLMQQKTQALRMESIAKTLVEEKRLLSIGPNLKTILQGYDSRNTNKLEREGDYRQRILELINQGLVKQEIELSFSETMTSLHKADMQKAARAATGVVDEDEPVDLDALKQETSDLISLKPTTGKNIDASKDIKVNSHLSRSGVKVDSQLAAALDLIVNRGLDRDKRIGTMKLLGEQFALMTGRLAQLGGTVRRDFNRWVQVSAMLQFQRKDNLDLMVKRLGFTDAKEAEIFNRSFSAAYPELTGLHSLMVAQRVQDFKEFNNEFPNEADLLHLYVPHAKESNDIWHLKAQAEGTRGGSTKKLSVDRFAADNITNYTHYDFLTNMVRLAEHIAGKHAHRNVGKALVSQGFIDTASVENTVIQVFEEQFAKMDGQKNYIKGRPDEVLENLRTIIAVADSYGLNFERLLQSRDNMGTFKALWENINREIARFPEDQRMGFYELYKHRDNFTAEQEQLSRLYEVQAQLAHFGLQRIGGLSKGLEQEFLKLQESGLVLVDGFGRRLDKIYDFRGKPASDLDAEHIKFGAYMAMDPLAAMLTGDVGLMDAKLADHLYNTIYHVKQKSVFEQVMGRVMSNAVRAIMSHPAKILSRLTTYTQSDVGLFALSDVRAVTKLPEARREVSAYLQSHGTTISDDFLLFLEVIGVAPSAEKGVGLDPIRFEERRAKRVPLASDYYDKVAELFESQTLITRYALWKQMNQNFLKDGNMGNVYHRREALKFYDNNMDKRRAAAYKAGYVVDNTMGAPGGFPLAARQLGQWMTFTTYPLALTRGTTESALSILAAGKDALSGDKVAQKSLAIPVGGSVGVAAITAAINAILVETMGGQPNGTDEDENDEYTEPNYMREAIWKGQAFDIPGTLWNGEALFQSGALMSPFMSMYEMFVEPWTQTYPDGTPVELDEKFWDAADTLVIGKLHPLVKLALETAMGKDFTGFGAQERDPMLTPGEHLMRKILAYQIGNKAATAMFTKAYGHRIEDEDMSYIESLMRGFGTAFAEEMTNSKQFKYDKHNHAEALKMVDAWRFNFEEQWQSTYNEQREEFNEDMLLFDADYIASTQSDYNAEDAKYMTRVLKNLMKNDVDPMVLYEQISQWREDGKFEDDSIKVALNRISIVRKLNSLKDPEGFYNGLSQKERAAIEQAILYEREMYPWMEKYYPKELGAEPYLKKDYTRFEGDGTGYVNFGSGGYSRNYYAPRIYRNYNNFRTPRSWDYYRKVKPRYRPNYTQTLYNQYQKKRRPIELMEVGNKLFVAPLTETTNNRKAKVENPSTNFKAQRVFQSKESKLKTARKYAKRRGE